jgi:hypothetical protein
MSHFGNGSTTGESGAVWGWAEEVWRRRRMYDEFASNREREETLRRLKELNQNGTLSDEAARDAAPQGERVNCRVIGDRR